MHSPADLCGAAWLLKCRYSLAGEAPPPAWGTCSRSRKEDCNDINKDFNKKCQACKHACMPNQFSLGFLTIYLKSRILHDWCKSITSLSLILTIMRLQNQVEEPARHVSDHAKYQNSTQRVPLKLLRQKRSSAYPKQIIKFTTGQIATSLCVDWLDV